MGKEFVKQHIVPKRYLDRFALRNNEKYIIGTLFINKNKQECFAASTSDVGYIKNFYDVNDKDDPKYWEHFFAREIDTLCGTDMDNIISAAMLSQDNAIVLSKHSIDVLSKIMVAQIMRVPSSVDFMKIIFSKKLSYYNQIYDPKLYLLPYHYHKIMHLKNKDLEYKQIYHLYLL